GNDTIQQGSHSSVKVSLLPSNATVKTVKIASTNESVATVNDIVYDEQSGITSFTVYGNGVGTAQIIVFSSDERVSASYDITVEKRPEAKPEPTNKPVETPAASMPPASAEPTDQPTVTLPPATATPSASSLQFK